jgi:hypothetical protein
VAQYYCLRLITGCHKKSSIDCLHQETKILKIKNHLELICSQFLAKALSPSHCSHDFVKLDPGPCRAISSLHTAVVAAAINDLQPNKVLGCRPPPIAKEEQLLPRAFQTVLSQLRSNYCVKLCAFLHSIDKVPDNVCPDCNSSPHTTAHFFVCPSNPTDLSIVGLWKHPCEVVSFLNSTPPFFDLPPYVAFRPRIPPEPPP